MKTPIVNFRLDEDTLAKLDRIAQVIGDTLGEKPSRSSALRYAVRSVAEHFSLIPEKKSKKSAKILDNGKDTV